MLSFSVWVLQCNPLANVSTVAGEPHPGLSENSDLELKLGPNLERTSEEPQWFDPLVGNRYRSQKPNNGQYTAPWCHVELEPQNQNCDTDGYQGDCQTLLYVRNRKKISTIRTVVLLFFPSF